MSNTKSYFISAGEPSGDLLASDLVLQLGKLFPNHKPYGIVGPGMEKAGVEGIFHIKDLSVMGFVEVIKHLPRLLRLEKALLAKIDEIKPEFVVLVDYPGFHLRIAEKLKARGIKIFMYVAPQLWAWGEKRVERLKRVTDMVLGIMPFEEEFFRKHGVNYTYVGTPQVDRAKKVHKNRSDFGIPSHKKLIGFFPGSRVSEVTRVLPAMLDIQREIKNAVVKRSSLNSEAPYFLVSVAESVDVEVYENILSNSGSGDSVSISFDERGRYHSEKLGIGFVRGHSLDLMSMVDSALVTSGTATLECGLSKTPMAVIYLTNSLTYFLAKRLVKLENISLVNLVAGKKIVEEYVQKFPVAEVAERLVSLAINEKERTDLLGELDKLDSKLHGEPGVHASIAIEQFVSQPE